MRGTDKFKNMNVKDRLVKSFRFITLIASISGILAAILMFFMDVRYSKALELNGFIQGDIGEYVSCLHQDSALIREIIMNSDTSEMELTKAKIAEIDKQAAYCLQQFEGKLQTEEEKNY